MQLYMHMILRGEYSTRLTQEKKSSPSANILRASTRVAQLPYLVVSQVSLTSTASHPNPIGHDVEDPTLTANFITPDALQVATLLQSRRLQ
jgi:hypothetical protein